MWDVILLSPKWQRHWFEKQLQPESTVCLNLGAKDYSMDQISDCHSSPEHKEEKTKVNNCDRKKTQKNPKTGFNYILKTVGIA